MGDTTFRDPFWINPCGLVDEPDFVSFENDPPLDKPFIKELIHASQTTVRAACGHARKLKEYMIKKHPSLDIDAFPPDMPLFNFLKFPGADLNSKSSISNIPIAYNCIQRHAVALEQMLIDVEERRDTEYLEYLRDQKRYMVSMLCSLYELIVSMHLQKFKDVQRTAMPDELRHFEAANNRSMQTMRDMLIVNHYAELMELLYKILIECEKIM